MRRKRRAFLTILILAAALWAVSLPALAKGDPALLSPEEWGQGLGYVTDQGDFLTVSQEKALAARAAEISGAYGCDVYIVTMDDYEKFTVGRDMEDCSDDIREGYGLDGDLIMMLLSVNERNREVHLMAFGDFGNASFTDYGKERMLDAIVPSLKQADWNGGCEVYLDQCERLLDLSAQGKPLDISDWEIMLENLKDMGRACVYSLKHFQPMLFLVALIPGALIAAIPTGIAAAKLTSVKKADSAKEYMVPGSVSVTERSDEFKRVTHTSRDAPRNKSRGGGVGRRGGTTVNSRGSSHAGRKF